MELKWGVVVVVVVVIEWYGVELNGLELIGAEWRVVVVMCR